jgi:hypothetical protein
MFTTIAVLQSLAPGLRRVPELPRFAWYVSEWGGIALLMGAGMPPDHVGL